MTTDSAKNMYLQEIHQFRDYVVANTNVTELASLNLLGVIMLLTAAQGQLGILDCVMYSRIQLDSIFHVIGKPQSYIFYVCSDL